MLPNITIHIPAIFAAVLASFIFGFLWHGPVFGKLWMQLMKFPTDMKPTAGMMIKSSVIGIIGTIFMAYVLVHILEVWRPSVWGIGTDEAGHFYACRTGFYLWLGFIVPLFLNTVAWEMRTWKLFFLNISYHFINLQLMAFILAYWRM